MADARRMGKMELFAHFADKFDMKRTAVRDLFEELMHLSEKELKRSGVFVPPGMCKLVVQRRKAREGRNPATGENYVYFMDQLSIVNEGYLRTVADQDWQVVGLGHFDVGQLLFR